MTISRGINDIAYIASGASRTVVKLDNLQYGPLSSVETSPLGHYSFPALPPGEYQVMVRAPDGLFPLSPASGQSSVIVMANTPATDVDFGFHAVTNPWHNTRERFDVNDDGRINALDALRSSHARSFGSESCMGLASAPPSWMST